MMSRLLVRYRCGVAVAGTLISVRGVSMSVEQEERERQCGQLGSCDYPRGDWHVALESVSRPDIDIAK